MSNQNNSLTDYIVETVFEAVRDNTIGDVRNNAATFAFSNVTRLGAVLIGEIILDYHKPDLKSIKDLKPGFEKVIVTAVERRSSMEMLAVLDDYVENSSYKGKNSVLERLRSVLNQNIKNANNNLEALLKKIGIDFDANKKSLSAVFNKLVGPNFKSLLYSKLDKLFNYGGYLKAMLTKFDPNNAEDYGAAWNSAIVTPLEGNFISGKSVGILEKIKRFPFLSAKNLLGITARRVFAGIATDLYFKAVYNSAEWVFDKLGLYDAEWYINTTDSITPFLFNDLSQNKLDNVIKIMHLISKGFRDGGGEVLSFEDIGTLFGDEDYKDMDYEKTVRIFGEISSYTTKKSFIPHPP